MRILYVTPDLGDPRPRGYAVLTYHHLQELSSRHEIDVLAFRLHGTTGDWRRFQQVCRSVHLVPFSRREGLRNLARDAVRRVPRQVSFYRSRAMLAQMHALVAARAYDVIHVQLSRMGEYALAFPQLPRVVSFVDPYGLSYARSLEWRSRRSRWLFAAEGDRYRRYDRMIAGSVERVTLISAADAADYAPIIGRDDIGVVPYAVGVDRFATESATRRPHAIVISGSMFYAPNVRGVLAFAREVFPRIRAEIPDASLEIVGADPAPALVALGTEPGVHVTGRVPDVAPYLRSAAVSICPVTLLAGAQTKILEAMAAGAAVVSTSAGNAGIGAEDGRELLIADDPLAMAAATVRLLRDATERARLATAAAAFVRTRFSWANSAAALERELVAATAARREERPRT